MAIPNLPPSSSHTSKNSNTAICVEFKNKEHEPQILTEPRKKVLDTTKQSSFRWKIRLLVFRLCDCLHYSADCSASNLRHMFCPLSWKRSPHNEFSFGCLEMEWKLTTSGIAWLAFPDQQKDLRGQNQYQERCTYDNIKSNLYSDGHAVCGTVEYPKHTGFFQI